VTGSSRRGDKGTSRRRSRLARGGVGGGRALADTIFLTADGLVLGIPAPFSHVLYRLKEGEVGNVRRGRSLPNKACASFAGASDLA